MLLAVALVVLAGCQGHSAPRADLPPRYESGAQVRDALERAGLGCQDFQSIGRDGRDIGDKDAVETDTCRVDNTGVSIDIWQTLGQAQDWARSRQTIGCELAQSLGHSPPLYVDGGRWTIALDSTEVAGEIAKGIGGKVRSADCTSVD